MLQRAIVLCVLLATWSVTPAEAADFHCAAGDVACLIQAIRDANGNGEANTIHLEAGTYSLTAADHSGFAGDTGLPAITGSVAIVGAGASATIIQRTVPLFQSPNFRLFEVGETGRLDLEHLTLAGGGGVYQEPGAAVYSLGTLRIKNATVRDNVSDTAGTIYSHRGDLSVSDSQFVANRDIEAAIIEIGCTGFFASPCPQSAAIATITRSSFYQNVGVAIISVVNNAANIRDSDLVDNFSDRTGAILVRGQQPVTITNTTIIGHGGRSPYAILGVGNADVLVTNSTIVNNQGGVWGVRIQNSIVSGNNWSLRDCGNVGFPVAVTSLGHNLFGDPSGCGAVAGDLAGDPGFDLAGTTLALDACALGCDARFLDTGRPGGKYLRLLPDSPAVDAGAAAACPATDQQGLVRPVDGTGAGLRACDIGATEFYPVRNDNLQLEGLKYSFVKPSSLGFVDPRASAGAFRITATFRNIGPDLCHVAFKVPVLNGPTGTNPVLLTPARELLGGQNTAVSAAKAGAPPHLVSGGSATYQFTIGVQQRASINFLVDALGDATSGQCNP
jgi:hypothetical protein